MEPNGMEGEMPIIEIRVRNHSARELHELFASSGGIFADVRKHLQGELRRVGRSRYWFEARLGPNITRRDLYRLIDVLTHRHKNVVKSVRLDSDH